MGRANLNRITCAITLAITPALMLGGFAANTYATVPPVIAWTAKTTDQNAPGVAPAPGGGAYVASYDPVSNRASLSRFDSNGGVVWRNQLSTQTVGNSVRTDAAGNAYLAGQVYYAMDGAYQGGSDVFVRKYSAAGTLNWGTQFGTPRFDWPGGEALDSNANTYVINGGWQNNYGTPPAGSYTTVTQILPNGTTGWSAPINTGDGTYPGGAVGARALTIDSHGLIHTVFTNYSRGSDNSLSDTAYFATLSALGQVQSIKTLAIGGNSYGMTEDAGDAMYLASGWLYKYDVNGNELWEVPMNADDVEGVCMAPDGSVIACGSVISNSPTLGYLADYSSSGQLIWSKTISAGAQSLGFHDITMSGSEFICVGQLSDSNGLTNGNEILAFQVPEPGAATLLFAATLASGFGRRCRNKRSR